MKHAIAILLLAGAAGCSKSSAPPPASPPPAVQKEYTPAAKSLLSYTTPAEWVAEEPKSAMRKAQYRIPDKAKKAGDASLSFFSMAPQSVETITGYWRDKMGGEDGVVTKIEGAAHPTTLVDITGSYAGESSDPAVSDARFLGAIVETGNVTWYLKFVGPASTVTGWKDAYVAMLKGLRPIE